jgi:hypothetical protein
MAMTEGRTPIFFDTNVLIRLHVDTAEQHADVYRAVERLLSDRAVFWPNYHCDVRRGTEG